MRAAILAVLAAVMVSAADGPRVIFTKTFPGSIPPYVSTTVERSGAVAYKEAPDDDPETFQLEPALTDQIFDLTQQLDHFKHPLESGLRVANMGAKTFRWVNGTETAETTFNYSLDENAKTLQDLFERITDTERVVIVLRRSVRHDHLGVNDSLLQLQSLWDKKRLMGARQFLPLLDQVAKNDVYMHMARQRAAELGDAIRAANPKSE